MIVDDLDRSDARVVRPLRPGGADIAKQAIERVLHRLRVEGLAVMEGHALAQDETQPHPVLQHFPAFRQTGLKLQVLVAADQPVEDVASGRGPGDEEGIHRIPVRRVLALRDGQRAVGPDGRAQQQGGAQGAGQEGLGQGHFVLPHGCVEGLVIGRQKMPGLHLDQRVMIGRVAHAADRRRDVVGHVRAVRPVIGIELGHGRKQAAGIGMLRGLEDLTPRANLDDLTQIHDGDAVANPLDHGHVVTDE